VIIYVLWRNVQALKKKDCQAEKSILKNIKLPLNVIKMGYLAQKLVTPLSVKSLRGSTDIYTQEGVSGKVHSCVWGEGGGPALLIVAYV
jgi:hypothetical protein